MGPQFRNFFKLVSVLAVSFFFATSLHAKSDNGVKTLQLSLVQKVANNMVISDNEKIQNNPEVMNVKNEKTADYSSLVDRVVNTLSLISDRGHKQNVTFTDHAVTDINDKIVFCYSININQNIQSEYDASRYKVCQRVDTQAMAQLKIFNNGSMEKYQTDF